jgi:putative ABC transport system permease protein
MNLFTLVLVNLGRNKRRTLLTFLSVTVALFLFCALGGVLDTLQQSIKLGSNSRLVVRNAISLVFPMPLSYRDRLAAVPGVQKVAIQQWFGGTDPNDPHGFFAQFGVDEVFFPIYRDDVEWVDASPPQARVAMPADMDPKLAAYMAEQNACVVGQRLMQKKGWKLGQTVNVSGTIWPGSWPFVIRAVYKGKKSSMNEETMFFHWKYLNERGMGGAGQAGLYVLELADPSRAADIARTVDAMFENSSAATHTESEQAFQAGFVSMYGNLPFVLRVIGLAVVFAILLIAANTMIMAIRERTREIAVLKTLGFEDGTVFRMVLVEAAIITLGGGAAGALLAKLLLEGGKFNMGGMLPPMSVYASTVIVGIAIAAIVGAVSGLIPAWQASRLRIVDALRRVE